ncbi:fimbrial protein [Photobacterium damselae]|uniref:fimbrial protein n=1 Tax=Photobacterium damselae TaxID=38293 RepID=UPI0030F3AF5E
MNKNFAFSLALLGALVSPSVFAVDVNISITGEIYIPPCRINSDSAIDIPFGKIANFKIDGRNYAQQKTVTVQCDYYESTPYIKVLGGLLTGASDNVLYANAGANSGKLGIALYQGNNVNDSYRLKIGTGEQGKFGYRLTQGLSGSGSSRQFTFTSVPYALGNNRDLVGAGFTASATMDIYYL